MKALRVHAPGGERLAESVAKAVREFNRGLDIRLRFLSIGIEERVVHVTDAGGAAESVAAAAKDHGADVVVLFGDGPAALAAAAGAVRGHAALVRAGAGRREGRDADTARAIDRLAALLLVHGGDRAATLESEGAAAPRVDVGGEDDPAVGDKIVRALARARRGSQGGAPGAAGGR